MIETAKTVATLASGAVSCIVLVCLIGMLVKKVIHRIKVKKPDRDLKKLKKLQAKVGNK